MSAITLTHDQQNALEKFTQFLTDPSEQVFVLEGYSGTGKTTLVKTLLDQLPSLMKTAKLINPQVRRYDVELTATTNKAAENFGMITGMGVSTIHSYLGLRVSTDYQNNTTKLVPSKNQPKEGHLLFIDEASYIDKDLLGWIFKLTRNCKIVFMGDPAQLTPVKSSATPVFKTSHFMKAQLSQVVRQAEGNPIVDLSTKFRETVTSGEFFQFKPDGHFIQYMDRDTFNKAVEAEFCRPDWRYKDSKFLAWTNKRVIDYNHHIRDRALGNPHFQIGDYAVCNRYVCANKKTIKTDQLVCITGIGRDIEIYGVPGNMMTLDSQIELFFPKSLEAKKDALKMARVVEEYHIVGEIENQWVDLRAAYAQTINKSQGSTYDRVFVDLDDIAKCNSGDQIARMLYVGVSRAREQVYLTGDLV
jgi:hypothetical protein